MWMRFTERARKIVFYAQEEAVRLGENYVSPEHFLLGLLRENDSVAVRILGRLGVQPDHIRTGIERQIARGEGRLGQDMQLTPRAKRAIDLAYDEARRSHGKHIGTEHLLLGLVREGEESKTLTLKRMQWTLLGRIPEGHPLTGKTLGGLGLDLDRTRLEVERWQAEEEQKT